MKPFSELLWTLVRWSLPLTVAGVIAAGAIGAGRFGEVVRGRIEARLRQELPGLTVRVQAASLVEGEGIVARGVSIVDPSFPPQYRQIVWIDEVRIACGTDLAELTGGSPRITAIQLRRPTVHLCRAADGRWNLAALARRPTGEAAVPVTVEDATLMLEDAAAHARATVRQIALTIEPAGPGAGETAAVVRGTCASDVFERAGFEGRLAPGTGAFTVAGAVESLGLTRRLAAALPPRTGLARWLAHVEGRVDLRWQAAGSLAALEAVVFSAQGRLQAGRLEHPRLPFAVSDMTGEFTVDRQGLRCAGFEAHSGSTLLRGSGRLAGWTEEADFDVALEAERLIVGRQWEGLLPESLATHWSRLLPADDQRARSTSPPASPGVGA